MARINSARVFELGLPPCEVHTHTHTHVHESYTYGNKGIVQTARSEKMTRSTSEEETSVTQSASYVIRTHDLPLTERVLCQLN